MFSDREVKLSSSQSDNLDFALATLKTEAEGSQTPVIKAGSHLRVQVLQTLLENGLNPNTAIAETGENVLHIAFEATRYTCRVLNAEMYH